MINKSKVSYYAFFILIITAVFFSASNCFSSDWKKILNKINLKYQKFENEIKDMTVTQETITRTPEGQINSEVNSTRKGNMFRVDTSIQIPEAAKEMGGVETIIIYDGKDAWMILSLVEVMKLNDVKAMQHQMNWNWWKYIPKDAKIVGVEKVENRDCYVIDIERESKYPFARIWLDKEKLFLIKGVSKGTEGKTMRFVHSDFKKLNGGWEIPCKTEMYVEDRLVSIAIVKSVHINSGITDSFFDPENVELKGVKKRN
jgi:outer membrane lipoprotein-sorting protein